MSEERIPQPMGKKVYLAGPDVFFQDPTAHFAKLRAACSARGLVGLVPSDGGLSAGYTGTPREIAERIYRENIALIRQADAVIANLMAFRNPVEPDPGTVFEVGFAVARGKPVVGYFPQADELYEDRVRAAYGERLVDGKPFDVSYGLLVEALQQPLNLMLACSTPMFTNETRALDHLAALLASTD